MHIERLHRWDVTPTEAVALQREMAARVECGPSLNRCDLIAGADVACRRFGNVLYAGVVVLRMTDLTVVERRSAVFETTFPYVPGLLSFREAPACSGRSPWSNPSRTW